MNTVVGLVGVTSVGFNGDGLQATSTYLNQPFQVRLALIYVITESICSSIVLKPHNYSAFCR